MKSMQTPVWVAQRAADTGESPDEPLLFTDFAKVSAYVGLRVLSSWKVRSLADRQALLGFLATCLTEDQQEILIDVAPNEAGGERLSIEQILEALDTSSRH